MHPALRQLHDIALPMGDYALFGSGPLLVRGWIQDVGDLDVIVRGAAWERARHIGSLVRLDEYDIDIVAIGDHITVGTVWAIGDFSADALIDEAEIIEGLPCVRLEHVVAYKRIADRSKDRAHLLVIEAHLSSGDN